MKRIIKKNKGVWRMKEKFIVHEIEAENKSEEEIKASVNKQLVKVILKYLSKNN